jgi:hypothetical protein
MEAPLYAQFSAVARWLLTTIAADTVLGEHIHRDALALLDHVVLALKDRDRVHHVQRADEVRACRTAAVIARSCDSRAARSGQGPRRASGCPTGYESWPRGGI